MRTTRTTMINGKEIQLDAEPIRKRMEQYERILTDLDRWARTARLAATEAQSLEDKLRMTRVEKTINDCRHKLRLQYYEAEDAAALAWQRAESREQ